MDTLTRLELKRQNRCAARGDAEAQWMLGYWHEDGACDADGLVLVSPNPGQALRWYLAAAEQGHTQAQSAASRLLSGAEGVTPAFDEALAWGKRAVAQGDASAAFNLGTIYRDLGNLRRAFHWYQRSAKMGGHDALLQVGLCLLFGTGVARDAKAARTAFTSLLDADPSTTFQRSREDALYWLAVLDLLGGHHTRHSLVHVRKRLAVANADDDHEQANALLNLIGKTLQGKRVGPPMGRA